MADELAQDAHDLDTELPSSDLYSAEFIVDKKRGIYRGKKANLYRVRWTGYTAADDTWEPIENLNDALLSDFEESLKRRRPKQQSNPQPEDTPLVTWSDMSKILGLCPAEYLPHCLRPAPPTKIKCIHLDKDQNHLPNISYFSPSDISHQNSGSSNGSNQQCIGTDNDAAPRTQLKARLAATSGHISDSPFVTECSHYSRRSRFKQAAPSRSMLANVLMNY
jgi:hypothetical protein